MNKSSLSSADQITSLDEAKLYYRERLGGSHKIHQYDEPLTVVFEHEGTHLYSREPDDDECVGADQWVLRTLSPKKVEKRVFDPVRAQMMDHVLPALSKFTVAVPGNGQRGREKVLIHGPRLSSGQYMRVVLRPGPGSAWTCVSAFPVSHADWQDMRKSRRAKWPPKKTAPTENLPGPGNKSSFR